MWHQQVTKSPPCSGGGMKWKRLSACVPRRYLPAPMVGHTVSADLFISTCGTIQVLHLSLASSSCCSWIIASIRGLIRLNNK